MAETGQFAVLWRGIAEKFKLEVEFMPTDWRRGADVGEIEAKLAADRAHKIKAVCVVHNETSTSCVTHPLEVRKALNRTSHPALLMVDTISGLASIEYEHDAWGIDISVAGSQKGMMLPPGLSFNAVSEKALAASRANASLRSYWDWHEMIAINKLGTFPYTPAINLLFALREAIAMLEEEGFENVFARHKRHGAATRAAVKVWNMELVCLDPHAYSPALTAVMVPDGHDADAFRKVVLENFDMSLGTGLGKLKGRAFRIGHLGHFNDLMLMGTLSGIEMGLDLAKVPHRSGGVLAAMEVLKGRDVVSLPKAAVA
jgi:alanine-glyoxylate transaminase/serine-glyoxylate transaminase/serine-pyruvate transaminase